MKRKKPNRPRPSSPPASPAETTEKITLLELEALTGLTDRRHRQLAEDGFFPKPDRGVYERQATIRGLFRYYRERSDRDTLVKEKVAWTKQKRIKEELQNAKLSGEYESKAATADKIFALGEEIKSVLNFQLTDRLPALNAGLDAVRQRVNNAAVVREILGRWREFAKSWSAEKALAGPVAVVKGGKAPAAAAKG